LLIFKQLEREVTMGFRDSRQTARVCYTLLKLVRQEKFFVPPGDLGGFGPTDEAAAELSNIRESRITRLSTGEQTVLALAFYYWNGSANPTISALAAMEAPVRLAIGELIVATSQAATELDEWVKKWEVADPIADYFAT
jgi:hypothetical protein